MNKFIGNSFVNKINSINSNDGPFFCIEVWPPKEINEINKFISSITKLIDKTINNSFLLLSIVAQAENKPINLSLPNSSTSFASKIINEDILPKNSHLLLHITGKSINNYFVLTGDIPSQNNYNLENSFKLNSLQLIKRIKLFNKNISIAVAGYPECHPFANNRTSDILFLKRKIYEGNANLVICQFSLDNNAAEKFFQFVNDCREVGIYISFLFGILLFQNYSSLIKFSSLTKIKIPKEISLLVKLGFLLNINIKEYQLFNSTIFNYQNSIQKSKAICLPISAFCVKETVVVVVVTEGVDEEKEELKGDGVIDESEEENND
ncbi:hypothetical protein Mgra_00005423 [Meloidogyne graminicola]|uniref:Methylenetetrahydrofolate reductase (NAD(P)H) n=1 Tax=Meloidogyne graminicola TaxID=189291 RepID=A0A8S9ZPE9_9BILA|nr:hypothetical protein Mgra_00005423 [Meloidogyne graminicola]